MLFSIKINMRSRDMRDGRVGDAPQSTVINSPYLYNRNASLQKKENAWA